MAITGSTENLRHRAMLKGSKVLLRGEYCFYLPRFENMVVLKIQRQAQKLSRANLLFYLFIYLFIQSQPFKLELGESIYNKHCQKNTINQERWSWIFSSPIAGSSLAFSVLKITLLFPSKPYFRKGSGTFILLEFQQWKESIAIHYFSINIKGLIYCNSSSVQFLIGINVLTQSNIFLNPNPWN